MQIIPPTIDNILKTLKPDEEKIIRMRYGVGVTRTLPSPKGTPSHEGRPIGANGHTVAEVAKELDIPQGRVSTVEAKALRKLRHPDRSKPFRENFVGGKPPSELHDLASAVFNTSFGEANMSPAERSRMHIVPRKGPRPAPGG